MQGYVGPHIVAQGDGPALTNTVTRTSLLAGQAKPYVGSGQIGGIGNAYRLKAFGRISTVVTTPGTFTFDITLGAILVAVGSAMVLSTTAKTNVTWELEWDLYLRTLVATTSAATASFMHKGRFTSEAAGATTVAGEAKSILLPTSAPAVGNTFDPTAAAQFDLFGTWSVANASNSIQVHGFEILSLN